jgi:murein DD-endopeptidase MepM/ murein hydrolase activator NlpD
LKKGVVVLSALLALAKKLAKDIAIKSFKKDGGKNLLTTLMAVVFGIVFIMYIFAAGLITQLNSAVCRGFLDNMIETCPRPVIDEERFSEISLKIEEKRNKHADEYSDATKFRKAEGEEKGKSEAEKFLLIVEQLDSDKRGLIGYKDGMYNEGGKYYETNYGDTLRHAKSDEGWVWDKMTNKKMAHYFMDQRIKVWECFFYEDSCSETAEDTVPDKLRGILYKTIKNESGFEETQYKSVKEMLEAYYEVSLYSGLKNGKEEYDLRLEELLEGMLFNDYPEQTPGNFGMVSTDWLIPMEKGTYNFAYGTMQDYETRSINMGRPKHKGVDFGTAANKNVPIYAMKEGVVVSTGFNNEFYGGVVLVDHQNGYYSQYQHMETNQIVVKKGQTVVQGQMVGAASDTGNSSGIHLHWEICKGIRVQSGSYELADKNRLLQVCTSQVDPTSDEVGMILESSSQNTEKTKTAGKFYNDNKEKALKGEIVLMPGFTPSFGGGGGHNPNVLGYVASLYESSGDPSICVDNPSDPGGLSCGTHQIATNTGTMDDFLNFLAKYKPEYYKFFKGVPKNKSTFGPAWVKASTSNANGFAAAQYDFIYVTHYISVNNMLKSSFGFDATKQSRPIQEMIFSFSVQHRYNTPSAWGSALGSSWKGATDKQMATKMYDVRISRWTCCTPRFKGEKEVILSIIGGKPMEQIKAIYIR